MNLLELRHIPYDVVMADPPWSFSDGKNKHGGVNRHYGTMKIEDIMALPVKDIVADNAMLFLWCPWALMPRVERVMNVWGFTYKTIGFEWIKSTRDSGDWFRGQDHYYLMKERISPGWYTRGGSEPCFLGTRGNAKSMIINHAVRRLIIAPPGRHSSKPHQASDRITGLVGRNVRKLEMFATHEYPGWDAWGNGVDNGGTPTG